MAQAMLYRSTLWNALVVLLLPCGTSRKLSPSILSVVLLLFALIMLLSTVNTTRS